ncbi:MAG: tyrosine-type recombinase/integrase [Lachnospiraceae bacterium]
MEDFLEFWLEDIMRPEMTDPFYVAYRNAIVKHINPHLGNTKLIKLSRGNVQQLYNKEFKISESVAKLVKTIMNTSMVYSGQEDDFCQSGRRGVICQSKKKKTEFRTRHIDEQKTLNQKQVEVLIEAAKKTPIYLQVMFAVLMGLRRSEIIGVKYSDIDYINRTLHVERQLGKVPMSKKEDYKPKTYTKQEIDVKTESSNRVIPIPDILFEAILEEKQKYEKNRKRRINDKNNPFFDGNYICCSTYGKPRSKDFHWKYFKQLLQENDLPDIRWHDLRATYCTILLKNDFNPKAVSKLMGHAKEIITIDVYGDKQEIIEDCLEALEPFIDQKRI